MPECEANAPVVNNVSPSGNNYRHRGPFIIAGTYHTYCTIHPGMVLTIVVISSLIVS